MSHSAGVRVTVAVDAMGGDLAPDAIVAGAVQAARDLGLGVALVGPAALVRAALAREPDVADLAVTVVDAPEIVTMDESPLAALRRKPRASVRVAADLVARGEAQAVFSAGHTGATFLAAHAVFGVVPGVERPALAVIVPTRTGSAVLLDAGANLECRPEHLVQFGRMGAAYARVALNRQNPAVGLLSIGEEAGKGNDLIREAHAGLSHAPVNFIGNLEARELFSGRADVIVCDGFTGNIALKVGEGLVEMIGELLSNEPGSRDAFHSLRHRVDYAEHGAAPLLGVAGLVLVGHGRSSARAVRNAIALAERLVTEHFVDRLSEALHAT